MCVNLNSEKLYSVLFSSEVFFISQIKQFMEGKMSSDCFVHSLNQVT